MGKGDEREVPLKSTSDCFTLRPENFMLVQTEHEPKFRNLGKEDLNQNLNNKYFVPVDLWEHAIHPVIFEAKNGNLQALSLTLSWVNKWGIFESYLSPVGDRSFIAVSPFQSAKRRGGIS